MFRVIANPTLPASSDNIRTLERFVDIYDPRKNPWVSMNGMTTKQYFDILRTLWCRDNILENPRTFFLSQEIVQLEDNDFAAIFQGIPDHLLYCFQFVQLNTVNNRNQIQYIPSTPNRSYLDGRYAIIEYAYESSRRSQYSFRTENWTAEIIPVLEECHRYVETHIINHDSAPHAFYTAPHYLNNYWISTYFNYITGSMFPVYDTNNRTQAPTYVARLLDTNPDADLVLENPNPAGETIVRLRCPITRNNKSALHQVYNYSTSPMTMLSWPLTAKGEHKPVLYGIELEMSTDYKPKDLVDASDEPFFILKNDSSVSGSKRYMYELVTVPMSYKAHKKQWAHWFSNLDYDNFDCTRDTSNGMHVHIGQTSFVSEKHRQDFAWFFTNPAHQDFMFTFSERTQASLNSYAPMPAHRQDATLVKAYKKNVALLKDKRGAINYSNKSTIEVRLFRGIISLADVLKNLEFVDSVFHFTMDERSVPQITLKSYFKWLENQPKNKYHVLKKYFDSNSKLKPLIASAELFEAIFTERNPDKIMKIVAKKKIQVTNEVVTLLNRRHKKRIFILDKATGQLALNNANKSPVSFLDRLVEARILGVSRMPKSPTPIPIQPMEEPDHDEDFLEVSIDPTPSPTIRSSVAPRFRYA